MHGQRWAAGQKAAWRPACGKALSGWDGCRSAHPVHELQQRPGGGALAQLQRRAQLHVVRLVHHGVEARQLGTVPLSQVPAVRARADLESRAGHGRRWRALRASGTCGHQASNTWGERAGALRCKQSGAGTDGEPDAALSASEGSRVSSRVRAAKPRGRLTHLVGAWLSSGSSSPCRRPTRSSCE